MDATFRAEVLAGNLTEAKTGTPQIALEFKLIDSGGRKTFFLPVTDNSFQYTEEKLRTCGWTGDSLDDLSSIVGKLVDLVIVDEDYNGKKREKLKFINSIDRAGGARMDSAKARDVADQFRARIKRLASDAPPPPKSAKDEEDLPF